MGSRFLSWWGYPSARRGATVALVVALVCMTVAVTGARPSFAQTAAPASTPSHGPALSAASGAAPHLIVEFLSSDSTMYNYVLSTIAPHLLPGDYINIYDFSPCCAINPAKVGSEGTALRAVVPAGVTVTANTGLISNVQQMASAKPSNVPGLAATYEPDGATAPGTYDFSALLSYFTQVNQIDHAAGLTSIAYPTGHPLLTSSLQSYGWNYGDIAQVTDLVWIETQEYARLAVNDSSVWTSALTKLISQFQGAGEPLSKLAVQVTLGNDNHGTGTDPAVALTAIQTAAAMGIQNIYLWTAQGAESGLGTLITSLDRSSVTQTVTFSESGLPSGTNWSATLGGNVLHTVSSTISFTEPPGTFGFHILSPVPSDNGTRYTATPSSGSVDVNGANVTVQVAYGPEYYLQVAASPTGDGTVSPASGWYAAGGPVSLLATPAHGDSFSAWTGQGAGSYDGNSNPTAVTLVGPVNETAWFAPTTGKLVPVNFTEVGLPAGATWNVSLNGQGQSTSTATAEFQVFPGSYTYSIGSPIAGQNSGTRYVAPATTGTAVVGNSSVTLTVQYVTQYDVSISVSPVGSGAAAPPGGWFAATSQVTLSALPANGYSFAAWVGTGSGSYTGSDPSPQVTVLGPVSESAQFVQPSVASLLSIQVSGLPLAANWSVEVAGSNWTTNQSALTIPVPEGSATYTVESPIPGSPNVQYVAQPTSGTVDLTGGTVAVRVSFVPEALLVVTTSGTGSATMSPVADGWYPFGTQVEFNATAPGGSTFAGWNGSGSGSYTGEANPVDIQVVGPFVEVAHFLPVSSPPNLVPNSPGVTAGGWSIVVGPALLLGVVLGTVVVMNAVVREGARR